MKQAIELIRVSTASQADADRASIPAQRAINRRTAAAYGLTIVRSIEISDVSGAAVLLAPEIRELVTLMNDPKIHAVVAREFSRLMRPENFSDYALLQAFADSNTVLYLPEGPIDFTSKTGRLMGTIRAAIAGMERTEILERIWSAKEEKRRAGGFAQSKRCLSFGVDFENGKWSYAAEAERVREAFRLLLSGETSYATIGRRVGINPYSLRMMLRNTIYTGVRTIDERRDPSPAAKLTKNDGRQGDRKKMKRAPEDVIKVRVIEQGLISEQDFALAQQIMDAKKQGHWRLKEGLERRFTYHGFINCTCESRAYTKNRRDFYYVCSARCGARYMRRDRLEPRLDRLFARELTDINFLEKVISAAKETRPQIDRAALERQFETLFTKRQRILDTFFEGVISATERDLRLLKIEQDRKRISKLLARDTESLTPLTLAEMFAPFCEFDLLNREHKRRLLTVLMPTIIAANYEIKGVSFVPMKAHTDKDSLPQPT